MTMCVDVDTVLSVVYKFDCDVCGYKVGAAYRYKPRERIPHPTKHLPVRWTVQEDGTVRCARCSYLKTISTKDLKELLTDESKLSALNWQNACFPSEPMVTRYSISKELKSRKGK